MTRFAAIVALAMLGAVACGAGGRSDAVGSPPATGREPGRAELIVVDRSIGPVRIGMTAQEVRAAIGRPGEVRPSDLHPGWERWRYRDRRLTLTVTESAEVWDVRTRSDRYRSDRGLRVGLGEAGIRQRLPHVKCRPYGGPARYRRWRVCTSGSETEGPFTQVLLVGGAGREIKIVRGLAV